jgi:O-antigen ligase
MTAVSSAQVIPGSFIRALLSIDLSGVVAFMVFIVYSRALDSFAAPLGLSLGQVVVIMTSGLVFTKALAGYAGADWRGPVAIIGVYVMLGYLSLLYAKDRFATVDELDDLTQNTLIFFCIVLGVTTAGGLRRLVWGLIGAGTLIGAINLFQFATGTFENTYWGLARTQVEVIVPGVQGRRLGGPGLGPNGLAHMLTFCVPLAVTRLLDEPSRLLKATALVSSIILLTATVLTFSRNGFLTLLVIAALFVLRLRIPLRRLIPVVVAAGVLIFSLAPGAYLNRVATLTSLDGGVAEASETLSTGRLSEYLAGVKMFSDHPVLGVGLGNYPSRYLEYSIDIGLDDRREDRAPHSLYLQFASELGAVGVLWLAAALGIGLHGLATARRRQQRVHRSHWMLLIGVEIAFISFLWFSLFRHIALVRYFLIAIALALIAPRVAADQDRREPARLS